MGGAATIESIVTAMRAAMGGGIVSTAQVANKMLLLARTTPLDLVKKKTEGLSLFYTDLDRSKIEVRLIHKMGRHAVDSNMLFIQDLWVPEEDRIGKEGDGFKLILHGMNPERVLIGAEAVGIGRIAIGNVQPQPSHTVLLVRPVALKTVLRQDRQHVAVEIEAGRVNVGGQRGEKKCGKRFHHVNSGYTTTTKPRQSCR